MNGVGRANSKGVKMVTNMDSTISDKYLTPSQNHLLQSAIRYCDYIGIDLRYGLPNRKGGALFLSYEEDVMTVDSLYGPKGAARDVVVMFTSSHRPVKNSKWYAHELNWLKVCFSFKRNQETK